jgi:hypothetical protein
MTKFILFSILLLIGSVVAQVNDTVEILCPTGTVNSNGVCCKPRLVGSNGICCPAAAYIQVGYVARSVLSTQMVFVVTSERMGIRFVVL